MDPGLGWSLGLSSLSWVVGKNDFCCPRTPNSIARVLSHKEISEPLSRSAYVSTALFASRLRTFTGTTRRQTFPPRAEVLLVCPLGEGVLLLTWVPCSTALVLISTDCCEGGGWSKVWCLLLQPWTSNVLLALQNPTAMWPSLKQLWHNWAFLITCRRSSKFFSMKILHFTKGWAALHTGKTAYLVVGASLWSISWVLNALPRSSDNVALLGLGLRLWLSNLSRATSVTQPKTGLFAALTLILINSAMWLMFVLWPAYWIGSVTSTDLVLRWNGSPAKCIFAIL